MKLSREKLRRMILSEIRRHLNENNARNADSAKEYLEKRKNLTDDEKSKYMIAKIEDFKQGDKLFKRFFFMSDPVDIEVTPEPEEKEEF